MLHIRPLRKLYVFFFFYRQLCLIAFVFTEMQYCCAVEHTKNCLSTVKLQDIMLCFVKVAKHTHHLCVCFSLKMKKRTLQGTSFNCVPPSKSTAQTPFRHNAFHSQRETLNTNKIPSGVAI